MPFSRQIIFIRIDLRNTVTKSTKVRFRHFYSKIAINQKSLILCAFRSKNANKIKSDPTSHCISILTNSELDDYFNQKGKTSESSQQCGSNISCKDTETKSTSHNVTTNSDKKVMDTPILFLDVNFGNDKLTRIVMYKGTIFYDFD